MEKDTTVLIAVGSGTINDISKYVSHMTGIPYIIIATAPSMDGYASSVSALMEKGVKITHYAVAPDAIIGDLDILCRAPYAMTAAGFGDIMGKFTCKADWLISSILNNEYYCTSAVSLIDKAVNKCIENIDRIKNRKEDGIKVLMEALIISGIAILAVGNSRPASGSEHHMSHYWEMKFLMEKRAQHCLHGKMVGMAAILVAQFYNELFKVGIDGLDYHKIINYRKQKSLNWEKEIKKAYGSLADEIINLNKKTTDSKYDKKMYDRIINKWDELCKVKEQLIPDSITIQSYIDMVGGPVYPEQLSINDKLVKQALMYSKYVRQIYTVFTLADELGLLKYVADSTVRNIYNQEYNAINSNKVYN